MDTEAVFRSAAHQFAQEDDLAVHFAHGDIVIADALEGLLHLVELVIMGSEERFGMAFILMDILDNRPCDGDAVIGTGTSSEFVKEHETAFGEVIEDRRRFVHLDHEGGLTHGDIIRCADAREDLIHDTDRGALCGHE